jgi:hypothetical protein
MSEGNIDKLLQIWNESRYDGSPFLLHKELFEAIDSIEVGDVLWESFLVQYSNENEGDKSDGATDSDQPQWMNDQHEVFYHDPRLVVQQMLSNPDFSNEMDYSLYQEYGENNEWQYQNFMSGDWAWEQVVHFS